MGFDQYVYSGGKRLRRGYTTGTCAALAAKAAAELLFSGRCPETVGLVTPAGLKVEVSPQRCILEGQEAVCSVVKDAGDDYDVTDGIEVVARVRLGQGEGKDSPSALIGSPSVLIDGGRGVGRVTEPGLDQDVGQAAINSGPRRMIEEEVMKVCREAGYSGTVSVLVEVPEGEEVARRTFNSHLGVVGGISILGTSGIVEPQSLEALKDSLSVEVHAHAAQGRGGGRLIITPGNYGENFLATFGLPGDIPQVKCANFIGYTVDRAVIEGFPEVLLVGHIGKLVKVAGGIMDTHSRVADCRMEILAAHAAACGADQQSVLEMLDAATTDACLEVIGRCGLSTEVLSRIARAVQRHLAHRVEQAWESEEATRGGARPDDMASGKITGPAAEDATPPRIGAVIFSNRTGLLAMSDEGKALVEEWKRQG